MKRFKAGKAYLAFMLILAVFFVLPGCNGGVFGGGVWEKPLASIEVTPTIQNMANGTTQQFTATGIYSDKSRRDLTSLVNWSSSNTAVATIGTTTGFHGLAASKSVGGPITVTATDPDTGKTGSASLTVTAATLVSIGVTQVNPRIAQGTNLQLKATGIYTDLTRQDLTSSVVWSSSNTAVATISNSVGSKGQITAVAAGGPLTITAANPVSGTTGSTTLTVTAATLSSITVTPANPALAPGTTQQFKATGLFSDLTNQDLTPYVTWNSSNTAVATISNNAGSRGLATAVVAGGPITITATDPTSGKTGTTPLRVSAVALNSIAVTPAAQNSTVGSTQQFTAIGTYSDLSTQDLTSSLTWSSSNLTLATISNAAGSQGVASAVAAGAPVTITATDPVSGKTGTATLTVTAATLTKITVTPSTASIPDGGTQQFVATGTYSDATTRNLTNLMTWTTTPLVSAIATVSNAPGLDGLATALAVGGPVTISATDPVTKLAGSAALTVTAALPVPGAVNLAAAAPFGTFGGTAGMTNTGTLTIINGDIGTTATSTASITGFHDTAGDIYTETPANIGFVNGKISTCTNSTTGPTSAGPNAAACLVATNARLAAQTAYQALVAMPAGADPGANLAGKTLVPGVYTAPAGSFMIQGSDLTLDAQGNPNAVWVFQMATTLTVGGPGAAFPQSIILAGGAQAKNIFWQVGSFATINAAGGGTMQGTIISQAGAAFSTAGNVQIVTLNGRALSLGASVTLVDTVINVPAP